VLNRVPHFAVAEGEFRAFTPEAYDSGRAGLLALAGPGDLRSPADGYRCQVEVELLSETPPWLRNPGSDSLFKLWQKVGAGLSYPLEFEERGGLSDGNLLWQIVPTLDGLGPWGDNDHCSERSADGSKIPEFVKVSSFVPKAVLNTLAIRELVHSSGGERSS
jgi:glutamate carboxypeptidase